MINFLSDSHTIKNKQSQKKEVVLSTSYFRYTGYEVIYILRAAWGA